LGLKAYGNKKKAPTEAAERRKYMGMFCKILAAAPALAYICIYLISGHVFGQAANYAAKFDFIQTNGLGWIYLCWYLVYLIRTYAVINANACRAPARAPRPDQHLYKIAAKEGELARAPYVMMDTSGAAGKFNRAQRAVFNMDETLPMFLSGVILHGVVFGPISLLVVVIYAYGRFTMVNAYTDSADKRGTGFKPAILSETLSAGFVLLCAMKGIAGFEPIAAEVLREL